MYINKPLLEKAPLLQEAPTGSTVISLGAGFRFLACVHEGQLYKIPNVPYNQKVGSEINRLLFEAKVAESSVERERLLKKVDQLRGPEFNRLENHRSRIVF